MQIRYCGVGLARGGDIKYGGEGPSRCGIATFPPPATLLSIASVALETLLLDCVGAGSVRTDLGSVLQDGFWSARVGDGDFECLDVK